MVVVIMMMVRMIMRMAVAMLVMIVIMIGVSMTVVMGMGMRMIVSMIMLVVVMAVTVQGMRRRDRGADGRGAMERAQRREEDPPFHPQQPDADEDDERIAQDFDQIDRPFHGRRGGVQQRGGDAHEHHRDQRLQQRGRERQHHAAHPGLFVRDHVGRDQPSLPCRSGKERRWYPLRQS